MSGKVVITGLGLVTPLGVGVKRTWQALVASKSGIVSTNDLPDAELYKDVPSKVVGAIPRGSIKDGKWDSTEHFNPREIRRIAPFIQYAIVAAREAVKDAGWEPQSEEEKLRAGACIGSGIGSFEDAYTNAVNFHEKGYRRTQPLMIPRMLANMAAGNVSIYFGLKGPNHAVSTACATGLHSIGDAARFIKDGYADVMVAGATEASIHPLALAGFARAKSVVTKFNDHPQQASRPFDRDRAGFVLGEGAGIVVLESLEHAERRGCKKIYGEVSGYGVSGDATHITSPSPDGDGARRAMEMAVSRAGLQPSDIGYINAHATSTALGDRAENFAMKTLFGSGNPDLAVSSTKGAVGHLLGAAGSVEAIFSTLAMTEGVLPPTLNCEHPGEQEEDEKADFVFNYVQQTAQKVPADKPLKHVLTNSFGFGGTNASLCISKV